MKRIMLIISIILLCSGLSICQTKSKYRITEKRQIEITVINFLNWYKIEVSDTTKPAYILIRGGYPDTTTKQFMDMAAVEMYLDHLKSSGYLSASYINDLRPYFKDIADNLQKAPKMNTLVKIPGMDIDWILWTFEPEIILDHIKQGRFDKVDIIYNKAIVRFRISKIVQMLFTLTRINNKWLIDYIGYDASCRCSIARK